MQEIHPKPMRAWQYTAFGEPLSLREVPQPSAEAGQVVVDIRAAGLCHTDVGILEDEKWLPELGSLPLTLGHEVSGVISEVGTGVVGYELGDRVAISPTGRTRPGLARDGGYSQKCVAFAEDLVRIPANIDFSVAAIGTDAARAAYRAVVRRGMVKAGDTVGIIGLGGLGQFGAQIAVHMGANVYAAEINEKIWGAAAHLGVSDVRRNITEFDDVQFDLIVDFAGFGETTTSAIKAIKPFGTVVQVGMGKLEAVVPTDELIFKQATLLGSRGGTVGDIEAVYDLISSGVLQPNLSTISFEEISDGLDKLREGKVFGRLVAVTDG